jgi:hypothetical protein
VVLLGALFRYLYIKWKCWQQNSNLGNNQATNISKKEQSGNKKEKNNLMKATIYRHLTNKRKIITFQYKNSQKYSPTTHH